MFKKLFIIVLAVPALLGLTQLVYAGGGSAESAKPNKTQTEFGSCVSPKWSVSQVNKGKDHGVVGDNKSYAGVDKIYKSGKNALQCLCKENGLGVETKWKDASKLSGSEVSKHKKDGWIFIATGSSWGLKDTPYLAKNSDYTCKKSSK